MLGGPDAPLPNPVAGAQASRQSSEPDQAGVFPLWEAALEFMCIFLESSKDQCTLNNQLKLPGRCQASGRHLTGTSRAPTGFLTVRRCVSSCTDGES